jgi:hypothetical protein
VHTRYSGEFGGPPNYLAQADQVMNDLSGFIGSVRGSLST